MKLRNKKTGEVVEDGYVRETHDFQFDGQKHVIAVFKGNGHRPPERVSGAYTSLAELKEEWEDYEELKKYWYIDTLSNEVTFNSTPIIEDIENDKQIGNYFESEEEAEQAVERLKAWKRLRDKGFRFDGIEVFYEGQLEIDGVLPALESANDVERLKIVDDLNLLFGEEK